MKTQTIKKFFAFIVTVILFPCQKEFGKPDTVVKNAAAVSSSNVNVYIAGNENRKPICWKNGSPVYLAMIGSGVRNTGGIVVLGNYVYVGGTQISHSFTTGVVHYSAISWKNDSVIFLPNGLNTSGMAVSGNDVYFSRNGSVYLSLYGDPMYWKNGSAVNLAPNSFNYYTSSISVSGNNVYLTDSNDQGNFSVAQYWKNGSLVKLTKGTTNAYATSIAVSGTNVYVAGHEDSVAKYWKNSIAVMLSNYPSSASSIAVSGTDVYVAGTANGFATYWKNGVATTLSNFSSGASAIAVSGTDVYIAGTANGFATYWKNGVAVTLNNVFSGANSIFITN